MKTFSEAISEKTNTINESDLLIEVKGSKQIAMDSLDNKLQTVVSSIGRALSVMGIVSLNNAYSPKVYTSSSSGTDYRLIWILEKKGMIFIGKKASSDLHKIKEIKAVAIELRENQVIAIL